MLLLVGSLLNLMWVDDVVLVNDLWSALGKGEVLSLEELSALLGGRVHTEDEWVVLVGLGEGVELLLGIVDVALVSEPQWLWHFVEEESGRVTLTELLETEPLEDVWLLSFTPEWHWSGLSVEIVHSIVPSLSGVGINLPAVSVLGLGPLWHLETFVENSGLSIELDLSHSLHEGLWVEVLSVNMPHEVWLLMELLAIEVLNTNTYTINNN